ncbi:MULTISPECIES: glycoside hydrolase family 27 protein [unclassified Mycobacterium]|uniref:glycoside hydrolase family 27 protein n=1 Tax=unclassified Mycobacterium TaxID=2642494 RepID=UPI0029C97BE4|nr:MULTISPECIES: glycoside hydrolase family 27 protein [unclassified Mycobacterium]
MSAAILVPLNGCAAPPTAPEPALPLTPPMGWNSWNSGIELTEQNVESTIDAMVSSGMRDAGYRYVNLDAGWDDRRNPDGKLRADPARFPDGIAALARYAHDRGMLLGLYASPYDERCSENPAIASAGHETVDAQTFAAWGVDYLKYDWCRTETDHQEEVRVFSTMRDALRGTERRILYSINPNSSADHTAGSRYDWSGIADMARATEDLVPVWHDTLPPLGPFDWFAAGSYLGVPDEFAAAQSVRTPSRPGYWNDADMLVGGLGWNQFVAAHFASMRKHLTVGVVRPDQLGQLHAMAAMSDGQLHDLLDSQPTLTEPEQRAHLSLWAMLAAPLLAGNDIRSMTAPALDMLTNRDVIAVDQDPKVEPAHPLPADPRVLVRALDGGAIAVAFFNSGEAPSTITTDATTAGLPSGTCYRVKDLWSHRETTTAGTVTSGVLPPHAVALLRITPGCR